MKPACAALIMLFLVASAPFAWPNSSRDCNKSLQSRKTEKVRTSPDPAIALESLSTDLPSVFEENWLEQQSWYQLLEHFALPSLRLKSPLLVSTLVGGGNSAKSTLLNAFPALISGKPSLGLNNPISVSGYRPGLTQRMLVTVSSVRSTLLTQDLFERYGDLALWQTTTDSAKPGLGILAEVSELPENLAFVDSPDFDSGDLAALAPDNLERALRVVGPSDVLVLMFNPQNVRNLSHAKVLARLFKEYGPKRTILVYWGDPSMPRAEAQALLNGAATAIYQSAQGALDGVLGSYLMPYSSEVAAGKAHPKLIPLNGSPEFPDLVQTMNRDALTLKRYSFDYAKRTIVQEISRELRQRRKAQMAARVYRAGLTAVIDSLAREAAQEFPYTSLRDDIRRRYTHITSALSQTLQSVASWVSVPEAKLTALFQQISRRTGHFRERLEASHRLGDQIAISQLFLQLQQEELTFTKVTPAVQNFKDLNDKYLTDYPEEKKPSDATPKTSDGKLKVKLPALELLPESVRQAFVTLKKSDADRLTQDLSAQLNSAQFDRTLTDTSRQEIYTALSQVHDSRSARYQLPLAATDILTLVAPAATTFILEAHGVNSTLIYLAAINLAARPFYMASEALRDRFLRTRLNEWFQNIQYRTTLRFLRNKVLKSLLTELDQNRSQAQSEEESVKQIEDSLESLKPPPAEISPSSSGQSSSGH